jgi:predicted DNA-binding transcriptional regulator AlpA
MQKQAYTIPDFLAAYSVSRSALYRLWQEHRGPEVLRIGRKVTILVEDAKAWAERMKSEAI